jgi:hypothetical protein
MKITDKAKKKEDIVRNCNEYNRTQDSHMMMMMMMMMIT